MIASNTLSKDKDPPRALTCPITLDIMRDPVQDEKGHTFERAAIESCLRERPGVCPLTNDRYSRGQARLTSNRAIKNMIDEYLERTGGSRA
eukprot:1195553-Prorocentrum_minimum.AAC.4